MEEIESFIEDLIKLCQKHGMVISNQAEDGIMIAHSSDFDLESFTTKQGAITRPYIWYIAPSGLSGGRTD